MKGNIRMDYTDNKKVSEVLIWGAGQATREFLKYRSFYDGVIDIIAVVDNNNCMWGDLFESYPVILPKEAYRLFFDCIIIHSKNYYKEIEKQIISEADIEKTKIDNPLYVAKCKLYARYHSDVDKRDLLSYIRTHELGVFNYPFKEKYERLIPDTGYDQNAGLYYVLHNGQRMYMARRFDTVDKVAEYYRDLCVEQDKQSPHLYLEEKFDVEQDDVVVDAGAAEGIFALSVIEKARKVYLIETDKEWIEALRYTFKNYNSKVKILNTFIADYEGYNTNKLDHLINEEVNFIKMDVEGCEYPAINGAKRLLRESAKIRCAICVYHNDHDEILLEEFGKKTGFKTEFSKGYMFYWVGIQQHYILPTLRRGIIRYTKRKNTGLMTEGGMYGKEAET